VARRDEVLAAAVGVLGDQGIRAFTHRAVDAAAGVPAGTAANYFPTRDALLTAVVDHFGALEQATWAAIADRAAPATAAQLAAALADFLREALGAHRRVTVARHVLFLEAAHRPALRASLAASAASMRRWGATWLAALGSADPEADAQVVLDHLDGVLIHRLVFPGYAPDPEPALGLLIEALLRDGLPPAVD
jgi:DNA-binding transcriptional regulator YbjK